MCGIVGVLDRDGGAPVSTAEVEAMCARLVHRGPDDQGVHVDGGVGIGMRRLSIIDVSSGHQPISNEDGTIWIVFNGEIYNFRELRAELEARHRFRTHSDTEVILHLYEEEGPECARRLRGIFAFAIWDGPRQRLVVARDHLGVKPLFYADDGRRLRFASEIKAILADPSTPREIDWTAVDACVAYGYVPAPYTAYKAIRKLDAGHVMIAENGRTTIRKYWDLSFASKFTEDADTLAHMFTERFERAVGMQLVSEVPLGAFLSGGVDSSLVVAMMSRQSENAVRTFTVGFGGDTGNYLDERGFAREVSERWHTAHTEFAVSPTLQGGLSVGLESFDEPFADDSLIPTSAICERAKDHVTVVLTGLGGDENFAGYERHLGMQLSSTLERLPRWLRRGVIGPIVGSLREEKGGHYRINHLKRFLAAAELPPARRYQRYITTMPREERAKLYVESIRKEIDFEAVDRLGWRYFEAADSDDLLDRVLYQDMKMYLPDDILALNDRIGMHYSLELRVPFVDFELVEFCARIPSNLKIRSREKKHLLRRAAKEFVPASILEHRKQGFAAPLARWLRGDSRTFVEQALAADRLGRAGLFVAGEVDELRRAHLERRSMHDRLIFSLLAVEQWLEREIDRPRVAAFSTT